MSCALYIYAGCVCVHCHLNVCIFCCVCLLDVKESTMRESVSLLAGLCARQYNWAFVCTCVCVCVCVSAGAQNVYCCVFVFAYGLSVYTNHAHRHRLAGAYLAENVYVLCIYYFYFVHMSLLACKNLWILKNWKAHVSVVMFVGLWECACTLTHARPFVLAANRFCTAALFSFFSVI